MLLPEESEEILTAFPAIQFGMAYGSGAIQQGGYTKYSYQRIAKGGDASRLNRMADRIGAGSEDLPMIDFIFVVEDSVSWHKENLERNPSHYTSSIPFLTGKIIGMVQDNIPAYLWFNAYVPLKSTNRLMKYGVINRKNILTDLEHWNTLYIAGRMHKPVHIIKSDPEIEAAMENNRRHAVRTSLMLLPQKFSERDLFLTIASLSYIGDPRMYFGENPKKVVNLVDPLIPSYRKLYLKAMDSVFSSANMTVESSEATSTSSNSAEKIPSATTSYQRVIPSTEDVMYSTTKISEAIESSHAILNKEWTEEEKWKICQKLPTSLQNVLGMKTRRKFLSEKVPSRGAIRSALSSIVTRSASMQSFKGLVTIGVLKSSAYIIAKISKRIFAPTGLVSSKK